jgi:hypothetical protein
LLPCTACSAPVCVSSAGTCQGQSLLLPCASPRPAAPLHGQDDQGQQRAGVQVSVA